MTEQEILAKVASEGWTILQQKELGQEGTGANLLINKALAVFKPLGSILDRRWFKYYVKTDGSCYWQEYNPFPAPPATSFRDELNAKIAALVTAGTIKAGYIEKTDEGTQTAIAVAVKPDNTLAMYHVYKVGGALNITAITGAYPI